MSRVGMHHVDLVVSSLGRSLPLYHHLTFEASSPGVDERFRWAREQGLEIENEPQEWPYVPGYYATFFHDPDGIKLEVVYVP
jgi:catechol 2,3-dioxygenase-like lactoylglutathione lyase family enzyme